MEHIRRQTQNNLGKSYTRRDGLVFYKTRVVMPPNTPLINQLLQEFHDTQMGGHSIVLRTFKRSAQQFYWSSMHCTVQEYVKSCETFQKNKIDNISHAELLQPLSVPCQVWDDITMDFIEGLPSSHSRDTILVVVDCLRKYTHLYLYLTLVEKKLNHKQDLMRDIKAYNKKL